MIVGRCPEDSACIVDRDGDVVTSRQSGFCITVCEVSGFDTNGKNTSIADVCRTRSFIYDETLQLTGGGYADAPESYVYDAEGNRISSHLSELAHRNA